MPNTDVDQFGMSEDDWTVLLRRIKAGKCTPFIGAGACAGILDTGAKIAENWATKLNYPLADKNNLMRVAQYRAIQRDAATAKEEILDGWFSNIKYEDILKPDTPHVVLAKLPLSLYITTNYDNLMNQALKLVGKEPHREVCRWNSRIQLKLRNRASVFEGAEFEPNAKKPVVYHLHGYDEMDESLVLTEDDYIDFLLNLSANGSTLLPPSVQEAIATHTLLFIGYSLKDINFLVLFRGIINSVENRQGRDSFTLQFPESEIGHKEYFDAYFRKMNIRAVWGDAREFASKLNTQWEQYSNGNRV